MAKFRRNVLTKDSKEENLNDLIHDNMSKEELSEFLNKLRVTIRANKSTKSSVRFSDGYMERLAFSLLDHYDTVQDKETARKALEVLGDELIKSHNGDKLDDLSKLKDSYKKGSELIYRIHAKTLIEGNAKIPDNISIRYIKSLLIQKGTTNASNLLFDNNIVNFLIRLGESNFSIEKPDEYEKLIGDLLIDPIQNNPTLAQDPRISHNRGLLDIAIQYVRSLDKNPNRSDIDSVKVLKTIKNVFGEYIDSLPEAEKAYIEKRLNKYSAFEFKSLKKDITAYTSFAEFMADTSSKAQIMQDPVAPHTVYPVNPINHGSKVDNVMMDDDKFRAIQDAVLRLRQRNPLISVGTVLVGVQDPFKGYILFPLENIQYQVEYDAKNAATSQIGSNLLMSEIFGNTKGGALYIMTKQNADQVFSVTDPNQIGTNNGPGTRTISKTNRPGLVTVHHYTQAGFAGYESMVFDAVDDIVANPSINREYRRPRVNIRRPVGNPTPNHNRPQGNGTRANGATARPVQIIYNVQTSRNPSDFDDLGICVDDLRAVKTGPSEIVQYSDELVADVQNKYANGQGVQDAKEFKLLDHVIEKMFIDGQSMQDICLDIANKYGVDPMQAFIYVKGVTGSMAKLDPTHATEKLKSLYRTEIDRMKKEMEDMKLSKASKETRLEELTKRAEEIKKMYGGEDR